MPGPEDAKQHTANVISLYKHMGAMHESNGLLIDSSTTLVCIDVVHLIQLLSGYM